MAIMESELFNDINEKQIILPIAPIASSTTNKIFIVL